MAHFYVPIGVVRRGFFPGEQDHIIPKGNLGQFRRSLGKQDPNYFVRPLGELTPTLEPLAGFEDQINLITGMDRTFQAGTDVHAQCASCYLSSAEPWTINGSAWPLDRAYDLPLVRVRRLPAAAGELAAIDLPPPPAPNEQAVAWLVAWNQLGAPATLAALLAEGYRVQVSMEAIEIATSDGPRRFPRGSLVVHPGLQPPVGKSVVGRLGELSRRHGVRVFGVERGLSLSGPDLGSPSVPVLTKPRIGLLTGDGVNSYHAGSIWHWFDVRLGQAVAQLDTHRLTRIDLSAYTHLIVPDGAYGPLGEAFTEQLAGFVRDGGTLIAARSAATWVEGLGLNWNFVAADSESEENPAARRDYADFDLDFARTLIGGSALLIDLDPTHPLGFGYQRRELAVFRRGAHILKRLENAYAQAAVYADSPLAGGYLGEQTAADLAGSPALDVSLHGRGRVIRMADDYLFRGYWRGAERLFANALFFAELIETTEMPADRTAQTGDGP